MEIPNWKSASSPAFLISIAVFLLLQRFFNASRMNASVNDPCRAGELSDVSANRGETGDRDHTGRIVHYQFTSGKRFNRFDVTPFSADDSSLHFVAR